MHLVCYSGADNQVDGPSNRQFLRQLLTDKSWNDELNEEFQKDYFVQMEDKLSQEYSSKDIQVFPPMNLIFNAFNLTPFTDVRFSASALCICKLILKFYVFSHNFFLKLIMLFQ